MLRVVVRNGLGALVAPVVVLLVMEPLHDGAVQQEVPELLGLQKLEKVKALGEAVGGGGTSVSRWT